MDGIIEKIGLMGRYIRVGRVDICTYPHSSRPNIVPSPLNAPRPPPSSTYSSLNRFPSLIGQASKLLGRLLVLLDGHCYPNSPLMFWYRKTQDTCRGSWQ